MKRLLLFCLTVLLSSSVWAYDFEYKDEASGVTFYYNILSEDDLTCEVTWGGEGKYVGTPSYVGHITIPETVEYAGIVYTTVTIGDHAFYASELTEVTIPETVTSIEEYAFEDCVNLKEIDIPNSVTIVGDWALSGCDSMERVTIGEGVESLGEGLLCMDYSLKEIVVADANKYFCAVDNVLYDKAMTTIIQYPLAVAATTFSIPDGVTTIGYSAFSYNTYLEEILLPSSVTAVESWAFSGCTSLKSLDLPRTMTIIPRGLFTECTSLEEVTIPDYVTNIEVEAFQHCTSLKEVVIPNLVTSLDELGVTFSECTSLERVVISQKMEFLGYCSFRWCDNLTEVYSLNAEPPQTSYQPFYGDDLSKCILYVPIGSKEAYASITEEDTSNPAYWWHVFPEEHIIEIALTEVETGLAYLESETSMTLTGSVTAGEFDISEWGFEYWGEDGTIHQVSTTEDMTLTLTELTEGEVYTYRAYAIDSLSKFYGEERTFTAGVDGIDRVTTSDTATNTTTGTYNLAGQRVSDSAKGVIIKDGRKVLVK